MLFWERSQKMGTVAGTFPLIFFKKKFFASLIIIYIRNRKQNHCAFPFF